jgi:uncharacterized integral membrane protein
MNTKLLLKTVFLLVMLLLIVVMAMHNRQEATLVMPRIPRITQPAALMYFGFFAVGVLTGTILTAGRKGGGAKSSKGG